MFYLLVMHQIRRLLALTSVTLLYYIILCNCTIQFFFRNTIMFWNFEMDQLLHTGWQGCWSLLHSNCPFFLEWYDTNNTWYLIITFKYINEETLDKRKIIMLDFTTSIPTNEINNKSSQIIHNWYSLWKKKFKMT